MLRMQRLMRSFHYAISGIVYCYKTQPNMRIHFFVAILVLVLGIALRVTAVQFALLAMVITLVLVCEMFNTALEAIVDMFTKEFNLLAMVAKNVAAGAVLVSVALSVLVGYFVFSDAVSWWTAGTLSMIEHIPTHFTVASLVITVFIVIIVKSLTQKGTYLHGGFPSGHSAVAFSLATAVAMVSQSALLSVLGLLLALLVAQSRVESKTHSIWEVVAGGLLGIIVTMIVLQVADLALG